MKELLKEMREVADTTDPSIDDFALRVILIAVADYYHSMTLAADQRDDIFKERILKWFERADDDNDSVWSDETADSKDHTSFR